LTRATLLLAAVAAYGCGSVTASTDAGADASASGAAGASGHGGATGSGSGGRTGSGGAGAPTGQGGGVGSDCRSQADCASGTACLAPGDAPGCGVCRQITAPCNADSDCASRGPASICVLAACSCSDAKSCVTGCQDSSACGAGQFCTSDHRCMYNVCTVGDKSCLPNFTCGSDGHCTRQGCAADADCVGACVNGLCYPRPGVCTPAAA
jgi:hypothetical protein